MTQRVERARCPVCGNLGWILEGHPFKEGLVHMELLPCTLPDCEHSGRAINVLSLNAGEFRLAHPVPGSGGSLLMSVTT